MGFSFVVAWSMLVGFERFDREVYTLLHSNYAPKKEKESFAFR
jgi:hypothetical protein